MAFAMEAMVSAKAVGISATEAMLSANIAELSARK
jgi:hypothetical protein